MFLKYINENKLVNLNNFDYIEMEARLCPDGPKYFIEACKLSSKLNIDFTYGEPESNVSKIYADGIERLLIKIIENEEVAERFYKALEEAWMYDKQKVYEIDS